MPNCVCSGATLQCSFGVAPSVLNVLPINRVMEGTPAANIMDFIPIMNIAPFALCNSPSNPVVIALTAAAFGVPTPAPCIPVTVSPWIAGNPTVLLANSPILTDDSQLNCMWAGVISIKQAGQVVVTA
ncbi:MULTISPECIES: DUF4280 domain-containing protein [unclassified Colwellia]|jgi:hypothetical protein|uniref:DUF4280 domain-containing protein n=1 Tax=unclassified Colwellia TaxID=196834 RepID=UPI0015F3DEC6|nr:MULTISPECIES: DUF4280 domain-containing protein [unclassified Colwellia]MBA6232786.1 DUF4280 domain-containing protein [Colwellia sp. MB02u-7]MBA6236121.1 DUF4280 domain-containing protein [Colwellia sp. MB02u-11]MBA6298474.1 DUF4280 domain-containing protein [Colwellia sp. MB3u-22]MBA6311701.1 DUF4280 domain-containing protein [Colwellia sp. MB3u-64]